MNFQRTQLAICFVFGGAEWVAAQLASKGRDWEFRKRISEITPTMTLVPESKTCMTPTREEFHKTGSRWSKGAIYPVSMEVCRAACAVQPKCIAVAYDHMRKYCWPLKRITGIEVHNAGYHWSQKKTTCFGIGNIR